MLRTTSSGSRGNEKPGRCVRTLQSRLPLLRLTISLITTQGIHAYCQELIQNRCIRGVFGLNKEVDAAVVIIFWICGRGSDAREAHRR